jgi:hypothetical protein
MNESLVTARSHTPSVDRLSRRFGDAVVLQAGAVPSPASIPQAYRSGFATWYTRASIRSKPQRLFDPGEGKLFFPPELVPVVDHPIVSRRQDGVADRLLVQRLYAYLQFTSELEQLAVYPASQLISRRGLGIDLPEEMIADAYKICTDEAWHAQFSYDLLRQVAHDTEITPWLPDAPQFLRRLERLRRELDPELRGLADVLFTVVSETLISAILNDIPKDGRIYTAVRDLVQDHAEDEGRHRAFFGALLRYVWPALSRRQQSLVGPLIPQFIRAFLEPDYIATAYALASSGFNSAEIEQIIAESYPADRVAADVRAASRGSVRCFDNVGALRDPATRDSFQQHGLIPDTCGAGSMSLDEHL